MTNKTTGDSLSHIRARDFCSFGLVLIIFMWISIAIIFLTQFQESINQSPPPCVLLLPLLLLELVQGNRSVESKTVILCAVRYVDLVGSKN